MIIFDLDGTLALNKHREHFLLKTPKDWDGWHAACVDDEPNYWPIWHLRGFIRQRLHVEIWSGRSNIVRNETINWLRKYVWEREFETGGIRYGDSAACPVRMRNHGDWTEDSELKRRWMMESLHKPELVFDDRDRVVEMWRSHGVTCFQVAPGAF